MRRFILISVCLGIALGGVYNTPLLGAQEAASGVNLRATLTGETVASNELTAAPRSGSPMIAGFRSMIYPTWKIDDHWFITGAMQFKTRPYYFEELSTAGYGAKGAVLQASLNYSRVSRKGAVLFRAGELSTAFGAFPLRYDDNDNSLIDLPVPYGYYYAAVSILGVAGAQIDATRGKWDGRVQFANSSPANPRSLFAKDQYGNWAGGAGYTIRQGFRVGVSGYRGPYLDRKYQFYFPGEANPNKLPAHALGVDGSWARGHSSVQLELQKFEMPYTVIPSFRMSAGYGEFKQVLSPRWFVSSRYGFETMNVAPRSQRFEVAGGFRPDRLQLIKVGYELMHSSASGAPNDHVFAVQIVTTFQKSAGRE